MHKLLIAARTLTAIALMAIAFTSQSALAQTELHKLVAPDGEEGDWFGWSCSVSGNLCIIGANGDDDFGHMSGTAHIFDAITGQLLWKLPSSGGLVSEEFGYSVSISGNRAIVGAPGNPTNGVLSGAAYIYDVAAGQRLFQVIPRDNQGNDNFGLSVAIDGNLAVVGAPGDQDNGVWSGAAYVVDIVTGQVTRKIVPADGMAYDHFGWSVSLSQHRAVISARWDSDVAWLAGAAYVYDVTTGQQLHKLYASDAASDDWFGRRVSIDGNHAVIGAHRHDINGPESGAAYLFDVTTGQELAKLVPADGEAGDLFGYAVAISGGMVVVAAAGDDEMALNSGSAYVFDSSGNELAKLSASGGLSWDEFGTSVAIDRDIAVIGAFIGHGDNNLPGSAYVFDADGPAVAYCFGDNGLGVCPCGNDNDGSVPRSGCANGVFASGGHLAGAGFASAANDTLVLVATHLEPHNSGLFFQADNALSPGVLWGDGLRCAGGNVKRLQVLFADENGSATTTIDIFDTAGNIVAGDKKCYQCWYRNVVDPPCGSGVNDFNATNGLVVSWYP